ncbi:MAG: site-specific DNA-methyltransferase [Kiritimatiellae bacterium]|nr:site-specific DNA-methyltransferase [Kiritimatiellia bacterium]
MITPFFKSPDAKWALGCGDCIALMDEICKSGFKFDCAFADPPYFLSNGGISVQSGRQVCVDKGDWDKSRGAGADAAFTRDWLAALRRILKPSGTVWISGTHHNTFQVANALTELGYKILNVVTWQKTNPPPNLSCRYFTYSTEFVIWARREAKTPHFFDYETMRELAGGQQMRDVWPLPAIAPWEKKFGKHPTQKPLALLIRILLASTKEGQWVLDPFAGSCTTGIAAHLLGRKFFGIDQSDEFLSLGVNRFHEACTVEFQSAAWRRIADLRNLPEAMCAKEPEPQFGSPPPFLDVTQTRPAARMR